MEKEKKYLAGWWLWILLLVIMSGAITTAISYLGLFTGTVVERAVFENSYQYHEGMAAQARTYRAQIAEIEGKLLNQSLDSGTRANLEAQLSALRIQLNSINGGR